MTRLGDETFADTMETIMMTGDTMENIVKSAGGEDNMSTADKLLFVIATQNIFTQGLLARLVMLLDAKE